MSMLTQSRTVYYDAIAHILDEWEAGEKEGTFGRLNREEKRVIEALNKARKARIEELEATAATMLHALKYARNHVLNPKNTDTDDLLNAIYAAWDQATAAGIEGGSKRTYTYEEALARASLLHRRHGWIVSITEARK